ncbi:MAG: peptidylprolyl isomerase [Polyangiales bacterium]
MKRFLREPLVHFLLAGLGLFVLFGVVNPGENDSDPNVLIVDRDALLTFIQYRIKAFNPALAERKLDAMSGEELDQFIDDYVREEVLHREALLLGLDEDDYVIRRRLVQKLEYITEGFAEGSADLDEAAVQRYFDANKGDYYVEPFVTFTHVFFQTEDRPREQARALAEKELLKLNRDGVSFADAPRHGDRFLYHLNYVERTPDYVGSHFGPAMARALFELEPNDFLWRGPFDSPYGVHLVLLTTNQLGRVPELAELEGRVREDARSAAVRAETEAAIADVVDAYDVRVVYKPEPLAPRQEGSGEQ